jgi:hypothetical protein
MFSPSEEELEGLGRPRRAREGGATTAHDVQETPGECRDWTRTTNGDDGRGSERGGE